MNQKTLFVVNPIAGGNDKTDIIDAVNAHATASGIELITYETTGEDDEKAILALYHEHKPGRVIVSGGDGTIKSIGETLETEEVIIGIIPSGSANGLAVDLDFPTTIEEQIAIAFDDHTMEVDMISINGIKSLHLSDIGLNAEMIKRYENGTIRGKLGYAIQAVSTLTSSEGPFMATISANGQTLETEAKMIVMANSQKYGTGVTINPSGKMDDGLFEIVVLKNLDFSVFSKIVMGNIPVDTGEVEIITTDAATIVTQVPVHFQVDGEYCGEETKLDIKILHRQMRLAVPRP
ncbi:Diacylglycerol kinase [Flavobacterium longum]|uniref:diacylglycerol/lipid kinase family protein n=1 Tax=Flavobacterium longum TaxID=1299340 RepID=UPI0039E72CFE